MNIAFRPIFALPVCKSQNSKHTSRNVNFASNQEYIDPEEEDRLNGLCNGYYLRNNLWELMYPAKYTSQHAVTMINSILQSKGIDKSVNSRMITPNLIVGPCISTDSFFNKNEQNRIMETLKTQGVKKIIFCIAKMKNIVN